MEAQARDQSLLEELQRRRAPRARPEQRQRLALAAAAARAAAELDDQSVCRDRAAERSPARARLQMAPTQRESRRLGIARRVTGRDVEGP